MPSFDVVSEINMQEVDNAVNQAIKEIQQRYDFKGSKSEITLDKTKEKEAVTVLADDDYKHKAIIDIIQSKFIKRNLSLKSLDYGKVEQASGGMLRQVIKLKQGIPGEKAKEIVKVIKDTKMKVQASIQGDKVRVEGKKRDDLQEVIQLLKGKDFDLPLQFGNFRE